jgi:hypothetical protein
MLISAGQIFRVASSSGGRMWLPLNLAAFERRTHPSA